MTWLGYLSALLAVVVFEFGAQAQPGASRSRMPLLRRVRRHSPGVTAALPGLTGRSGAPSRRRHVVGRPTVPAPGTPTGQGRVMKLTAITATLLPSHSRP